MKKKRLLLAMNLIDDTYIAEATPLRRSSARRFWTALGATAAACATLFPALLVAGGLGLWLFTPFNTQPPDVSQYESSEYYPVIEKLNTVTFAAPVYKNNFDRLLTSWTRKIFGIYDDVYDAPTMNEEETNSGIGQTYVEATDNQVSGVIEGDLIKRSDRYVYYLCADRGIQTERDKLYLRIFTLEKENSTEVAWYKITQNPDESYYYSDAVEFYLSQDCNTVTVVRPYRTNSNQAAVAVISLDVSDPAAVTETRRVTIRGGYLSSRLVDGKLLLLSRFSVGKNPDFSDESAFLPQIDCGDGYESIAADAIIFPDTLTSAGYTVVYQLDEATLDVEDTTALLSYTGEVHASADAIHTTRRYVKDGQTVTDISRILYGGEGLEYAGAVTVEGYVNDQYSLDEYEGQLRVVTTTSGSGRETNANLYSINLDTMQIEASVEQFAPDGEVVKSVRFDGPAAYVCTALEVKLTDPVFFFDLSDLQNITYKDTGTIDGFSSSLVDFGDGYLLGIGRGDNWNTVKVEMYTENENGVVSVCKYEIENAFYAQDYKAYLIDRDNRMVGLSYDGQKYRQYVLLYFNGQEFVELVNVRLAGRNYLEHVRALLIDGYLYLFDGRHFTAESTTPAPESDIYGPIGNATSVTLLTYSVSGWDDSGYVSSRVVADCELADQLIRALKNMPEKNGRVVEAISPDRVIPNHAGTLPVPSGTIWIEIGDAIYRIVKDQNKSSLARVDRHLGFGYELKTNYSFWELLDDALYHHPYNSYSVRYTGDTLDIVHEYIAPTNVHAEVIGVGRHTDPNAINTVTLSVWSPIDHTATIVLDTYTGGCVMVEPVVETVTLQNSDFQTVTLSFVGQYATIMVDNTRIVLTLY